MTSLSEFPAAFIRGREKSLASEMGNKDLEERVRSLHFMDKTQVQYWDSQTELVDDARLNEEQLLEKVDDIRTVVDDGTEDMQGRFILITGIGDASFEANPALTSRTAFRFLIESCRFSRYMLEVFGSEQFHISYHTHYEENSTTASAITVLVSAAPLSQVINCAMRIRLKDLACVCLFMTAQKSTMRDMRAIFIDAFKAPGFHPISLLTIIFEDRVKTHRIWLQQLNSEVRELETATGMIRPGREFKLTEKRRQALTNPLKMLRAQHATNTELCYCESILEYIIKLGEVCAQCLQSIESLREECGYEVLNKAKRVALEERIDFTLGRSYLTRNKVTELLNRIRAQINVSFSLIAQKDSKINLAVANESATVAMFAARDSGTMKSITVLTLVFLPPSLITAIWAANIFHLNDDINAKIYVGTCFGITLLVLAVWLLYEASSAKKRNLDNLEWTRIRSEMDLGPSVFQSM